MSLIKVNDLPASGSVNRDDVYHWYQTTEQVANPSWPGTGPEFLTQALPEPIDYGYYVVPYAGFSDPEYPVTDGWIQLTTETRDLPVEFQSKIVTESDTATVGFNSYM